jgi:hypothetical protein
MTTVLELIEKLRKLPEDATIEVSIDLSVDEKTADHRAFSRGDVIEVILYRGQAILLFEEGYINNETT